MCKKIKILPGCISCGTCEFIAPEIFKVIDIAKVKKDIDLDKYQEEILAAISSCPVEVILLENEKKKLK